MQIIILGAGQVGCSLTESLVSEQHSVTVIDLNAERLDALQNRYDIRTVNGYCSYPEVLAEAGADSTQLLLAVTSNDEVNMMACQVAHTLFKIPKKIARIRAQNYLSQKKLFGDSALPIDVFFSPERLVTHHIEGLITYPGALQVLDFTTDRVKLLAIKITANCRFLNKPLQQLQEFALQQQAHCVGMFRREHWLDINTDITIALDDELYCIVTQHIDAIMAACGHSEHANKHIMIAGGGNIGAYLAKRIESKYQVKIIEYNPARCNYLSQQLNHSIVLQGDACDINLLREENIATMDLFCALTNDDENNIIACLQAKQLGASHVIALIVRPAYVDLIEHGVLNIDLAISPQLATADSILTHIRRDNMVQVHSLHRGSAQACEIIVHDNSRSSKLVGKSLQQLNWPAGIIIGAIIRKQQIIIPEQNTIIAVDDHIILVITAKHLLQYVEDIM